MRTLLKNFKTCKIDEVFLAICAILIPIPLYINIYDFSFFFNLIYFYENYNFVINDITVEQKYPHIPIGLMATIFITIYFIFKKKLVLINIKYFVCLSIFILLIYSMSFLKALNIIIVITLLLSMISYNQLINLHYLKILFKYYFFSFFTILIINFLSIVIFKVLDVFLPGTNTIILTSHHIFGLEIYQYYVVFIGVLNLLFGILSFMYFLNFNNYELIISKRLIKYLLIIIFLILFLAVRKISIIYLFIVSLLLLFSWLQKKKFDFLQLIKLLLIFIFLCFFILHLMNIREITNFSLIYGDRIISYFRFYHEFENITNYKEFLFGYREGIGGYSNLFIDLFSSGGFIGLIFIFFILFILFKNFISILKNNRYLFSDIIFILLMITFFFIVIILDNLINMNFLVPYYYINLIIIYLYIVYVLRISAQHY